MPEAPLIPLRDLFAVPDKAGPRVRVPQTPAGNMPLISKEAWLSTLHACSSRPMASCWPIWHPRQTTRCPTSGCARWPVVTTGS